MTACPDKALLESLAHGEELDGAESSLEEHLSQCDSCQSFLEECWNRENVAPILPELADWEDEQRKFLPTLRTVLASSFRARGPLRLEDFSFLDTVEDNRVTGTIGDLEFRELISCGGMGAVFRAYDAPLEREVAVKVLRPEYAGSPEVASLFLDEARAIAAIQHENILPIFDVARNSEEVPFFVMPLVEGGHLQDRLNEKGKLPVAEALDIAIQIARGLSAAHESGIVHRDVKPSNILLDESSSNRVRLADFGLARAAHHGFGEGAIVGTPGYVAPEIAVGGSGTEQADLYSSGVLFLQLVTGRPPSPDGSPSTGNESEVPESIRPLLRSLLSHDPGQRPESAGTVVRQLESIETEFTEQLRREAEIARQKRKRQQALGVGAAIFVVAILGDVSAGWQVTNSIIRTLSGNPVSLAGTIGAYSTLKEALERGDENCEIVIRGGSEVGVSRPLQIEDRSIHIRSSSSRKMAELYFRSNEAGILSARNSQVHLDGLKLRFRSSDASTKEGLINLVESQLRFERSSLRRMSTPTKTKDDSTLFAMRYGSSLTVENGTFLADRNGVGILAVNLASKPQQISLNETRFSGQNLLHSVSSLPVEDGNRATLSVAISNSTILSETPLRIGRGGEQVETTFASHNCMWQCLGPYLFVRAGSPPAFRERFSFSATDTLFASQGERIIESGAAKDRTGSAGAETHAADWNRFLGETAGSDMGDSQWVDWITIFRPGRPTQWNPLLDLAGRGASLEEIEIEDFR
ncbi:MAG: serine/threonine-protein kinase [Verrucomicrobiales bacterium]|nr:serine/threonine-protein kinase [Verrucomicrobiales bacterium]